MSSFQDRLYGILPNHEGQSYSLLKLTVHEICKFFPEKLHHCVHQRRTVVPHDFFLNFKMAVSLSLL